MSATVGLSLRQRARVRDNRHLSETIGTCLETMGTCQCTDPAGAARAGAEGGPAARRGVARRRGEQHHALAQRGRSAQAQASALPRAHAAARHAVPVDTPH